jgi:hypothetical protein
MAHIDKLNPVQFRTYYHGTNWGNVESILEEGLKAHLPGSEEPWYDLDNPDPGHPYGVYLTDTLESARNYGDAVFAVDLPNNADWKWTESEGVVIGHDISPTVLRRVE